MKNLYGSAIFLAFIYTSQYLFILVQAQDMDEATKECLKDCRMEHKGRRPEIFECMEAEKEDGEKMQLLMNVCEKKCMMKKEKDPEDVQRACFCKMCERDNGARFCDEKGHGKGISGDDCQSQVCAADGGAWYNIDGCTDSNFG